MAKPHERDGGSTRGQPVKVKSTTATVPPAKPLKLATRSPYKGKPPTGDPFVNEINARGGGSPKGP